MAEERLDQTETLMVSMKEELENLKVELSALKEIQGKQSQVSNVYPPDEFTQLTSYHM